MRRLPQMRQNMASGMRTLLQLSHLGALPEEFDLWLAKEGRLVGPLLGAP